jgi:hypothetical protein
MPSDTQDDSQLPDTLVGMCVGERYQVIESLSRTFLAEVYVARQNALDRLVVLKVFSKPI